MKGRIWRARWAIAAAACGLLGVAGSAVGAPAQPLLRLQQSHVQCPLAGSQARSLLIDSAAQWRAAVRSGEAEALGRAVRWRHERVLVVAMARQPTLGVMPSLSSQDPASRKPPRLSLRVQRPAEGEMAQAALSRPCVVAVLSRGPWRAVWVDAEDGAQRVVVRRR